MGTLDKLIRANSQRRTRLHTQRGELLPAAAIPDALRSIRRRFASGERSDRPWMAPSAITALARLLDRTSSVVLELGSGASTTWFAERAARVESWESEPDWAAEVREQLIRRSLANVELRTVAIDETPRALGAGPTERFDVVVVDCLESANVTRLDCVRAAARLVRPGGCLVLDDSDRPHLQPAPTLLPDWLAERYLGIKPTPLMAVETTLFRRPVQP
jgi:predicted O-methyltransferase YrrM